MKSKFLFILLMLVTTLSTISFAGDIISGQDGNGSDYSITDEERRLCKFVFKEMKKSKEYTVFTMWQGKYEEMSKIEIETKCCEINPDKCIAKDEETETEQD